MQLKATAALPRQGGSRLVTAALFKPLRLNFAQVCIYCGTRWCESARCVQLHDASVWAPCPRCDGFVDWVGCTCEHGVVQMGGTAATVDADLRHRALPDHAPDAPAYYVAATA